MNRHLWINIAISLTLAALLLPQISRAVDVTRGGADPAMRRYTGDLAALRERGRIRVLTTVSKTNFFVSAGEFYGHEYTLFSEYEKFLNRDRGDALPPVGVTFIPVAFDQLMPALIQGYGDVAAASLTVTEGRLKDVDFTDPYLTGVDEVVVTHKDVEAPDTVDGLSGRRLFVRRATSYHESLMMLNEKLKAAGRPPVEVVEADEDLATEDILELVNSGAVEMTVADSHIARIWADVLTDIRVHRNLKVRQGSRIAWMIRKDSPQLKNSLNAFVREHRKGTFFGNVNFARYYRQNPWIKNPLVGNQWERIEPFRQALQNSAQEYGFDWLLIAAMAYRESKFDSTKKGKNGGVGVLRVTPEIANHEAVQVSDVGRLDNNVLAATKYLAHLRDRYFDVKDARSVDRVGLALAAYHAGPEPVLEAQRLAKEMGLDPNRWFRNVEVAALQSLGEETAQYVSDVNKYYLIYRLGRERKKAREGAKQGIQEEGGR